MNSKESTILYRKSGILKYLERTPDLQIRTNMTVEWHHGDILDLPDARYIVQQCNCLTVRALGLAEAIARKFPRANAYGERRAVGSRNLAIVSDRSIPGSVKILPANDFLSVVCLFSQWAPGKAGASYAHKYPVSAEGSETNVLRLSWFVSALDKLATMLSETEHEIPPIVAFPYKIGCGLAGGSWMSYLHEIRQFSLLHKDLLRVVIVARPQDLPVLPRDPQRGPKRKERDED